MVGRFSVIFIMSLSAFLAGCETSQTERNFRSPHLPIFPEITPGKESPSNPYWARISAIGDNQKMTLNDTSEFEPDSPTKVGTIGTHYRFPANIYTYAMTDGVGLQWDFFHWNHGKLAAGVFAGTDQTWGAQLIAAKQVGAIGEGFATLFASFQIRQEDLLLECLSVDNRNCQEPSTLSNNRVRFRNQVSDLLVGVQLGEFPLGQEGLSRFYVNLELGFRTVGHRFQIEEKHSPSNYEQLDSQPQYGLTLGVALW